MLLYKALYVRV